MQDDDEWQEHVPLEPAIKAQTQRVRPVPRAAEQFAGKKPTKVEQHQQHPPQQQMQSSSRGRAVSGLPPAAAAVHSAPTAPKPPPPRQQHLQPQQPVAREPSALDLLGNKHASSTNRKVSQWACDYEKGCVELRSQTDRPLRLGNVLLATECARQRI